MTTWDEIGGNPAPGEPAQIRSIAGRFNELSVSARYARSQLAALQRGELRACWSGEAADTFALELELLPADLGKLERSLGQASTAVYSWAGTVETMRDQAESQRRNHGRADQRLRVARSELSSERQAALGDAVSDPIGAIGDALSGDSRLEPYERAVDDARSDIRRIENYIEQIRDEVDAAARRVARMLEEASRLGIQNKTFWEKAGEFFEELGRQLIVVLRFLDELVDLIAPWAGMALLLLSIAFPAFAPAFAIAGLALAALDFGLTATRGLLGDDQVTVAMLIDDGIDLGLALVGARSAGAGLGAIDDFGRAAKAADAAADGSKFIKAVDSTLDVIGTGKVVADYYLNIGGIIGVGPGSTFQLVVDVAGGDTAGWLPDTGGGGDMGGIPDPGPMPDPGPGPDPSPDPGPGPSPDPGPGPSPDPGPGPSPDPGPGPSPDPGPAPMPAPDPAPIGGGAGGGGADGGAGGGMPPIDLPSGSGGGDYVTSLDPDFAVEAPDLSSLSPDTAPADSGLGGSGFGDAGFDSVSSLDVAAPDGVVVDAGSGAGHSGGAGSSGVASAGGLIGSVGVSGDAARSAGIVGVGAVGLGAAAAGAKRVRDRKNLDDDGPEFDGDAASSTRLGDDMMPVLPVADGPSVSGRPDPALVGTTDFPLADIIDQDYDAPTSGDGNPTESDSDDE